MRARTAVVVEARHEHVALVAPVLRPRVLHNPVVPALHHGSVRPLNIACVTETNKWVCAEANGKHLVVKIGVRVAAVRLKVHARVVEHKRLQQNIIIPSSVTTTA